MDIRKKKIRSLIILILVFVILISGFLLAYFLGNGKSIIGEYSAFPIVCYILLTFFITVVFAYTSFCLNDRHLWRYIFILYLLSIFWIFVRFTKMILETQDNMLSRYLWYLYYVPMLFIPLTIVFMINNTFIKKKEVLFTVDFVLLAVSMVLILLVLTNNFHESVFIFDESLPIPEQNRNENYEYNWAYFLIVILIAIELIYTSIVFTLVTRHKVIFLHKLIYLVCVIAIFTYTIVYALVPSLPIVLRDMTLIYLFLSTVLLFLCVKYGLFISSGNYEDFYNNCVFPLRVKSSFDLDYQNNSYKNMDKKTIFIEKVKWHKGNEFIVAEDVTKIQNYNNTLKIQLETIISNNKVLEKQKDILHLKQLEESKKIISKHIEKAVKSDIDKMNKLVSSLDDKFDRNDIKQRKILERISDLCMCIKRKSYLALMDQNSELFSKESLVVFVKELLLDLKPKLKDFEIVINGFNEIPIKTVSKFLNFLYSLVDCLDSSYLLFLIFYYKNEKFNLKINLIDYRGDGNCFKPICKENMINCSKTENVYIFELAEEKNVL